MTNQSLTLTTESGAPVADNQNTQMTGPAGPVLLADQHLIEKFARCVDHFRKADATYGSRVEEALAAARI